MTKRLRERGEFCWINMLTPQPAEARSFFAKLLGWAYSEMPGGMGHTIHVRERPVGALFDLAGPQTPKGTPPHIGVMVKVENADATGERIVALGGQARPAFDIGPAGRMAVCTDPTGAKFDVWQSSPTAGIDIEGTEPGAPSWFEAMTTDAARATTFYTELFGWTPQSREMPGGGSYTTFFKGDMPVAGMLALTPDKSDMRPNWSTYFTVKNVDDAVREATALGGRLCMPAMEVPGVGRFAGLLSPQGVWFYVITYER